jgi:hypothetical protein
MDRVTRALSALLRSSAGLLPTPQRVWAEAIWAEAEEIPAGRERRRWLAGGLLTVTRQSDVVRRVGCTAAAAAAGAALVWLDWHPGSTNPAVRTDRIGLTVVMLVLALLPWMVRPLLGPAADNRAARAVRSGGYVAVYLLLLVMVSLFRYAGARFDHFQAFDQDHWAADMRHESVVSAVIITVMLGGYALVVLTVTARRFAVPRAVLTTGTGLGAAVAVLVYALMPFGNPLHLTNAGMRAGYTVVLIVVPLAALLAVGPIAMRLRAGRRAVSGFVGGLCAGTTAALLLAVLTIGTMLLFPRLVDLKWANPSPFVPHGTTYELQMTLGDTAAKYYLILLAGPILGLVLGGLGALGAADVSRDAAPAGRHTARRTRAKRALPGP